MSSIQPESQKIKKESSEESDILPYFMCGACLKSYKFYPSLYLHIKQKHDGIRPLGTKIQRPVRSLLPKSTKTGRPKKDEKDIDQMSETQAQLEAIQNDIIRLLAEELFVVRKMSSKPSLESVVVQIIKACENDTDKWLQEVCEGSQVVLAENKEKDRKLIIPDFEDDFVHLNPTNGVKVIAWFIIWLVKVFVKADFIPDLCLVMSRIWKAMDEGQLGAQDLDNKLVWRKVIKDCEGLASRLPAFQEKSRLLNEFIQKICQVIGKAYEDDLA